MQNAPGIKFRRRTAKEKIIKRNLKEETLTRTVWRAHPGKSHGPVARQNPVNRRFEHLGEENGFLPLPLVEPGFIRCSANNLDVTQTALSQEFSL